MVRVQSPEKGRGDCQPCSSTRLKVIVGVEPDRIEDLSDFRKLMAPEAKPDVKPRLPPKVSGNDYCPCRIGKKFKKFCGAVVANPGA